MSPDSLFFSTRAVTPEDTDFLYYLFQDVHAPKFQHMDPAMSSQLLQMTFRAQTQSFDENYEGLNRIILENQAGEPLGRFYYTELDASAHVVDISLLTTFRRQGIGTKLIRDLQSRTETVALTVARCNPAVAFYQELGFTVTGGDDVNANMRWDRRFS